CLLLFLLRLKTLSSLRMTDSSLLNSELELQQQEELYQQLLLQTMGKLQTETQDSKVIRPQPGKPYQTYGVVAKKIINLPHLTKYVVHMSQGGVGVEQGLDLSLHF
ncbi:hypothetical protein AMECASPLE_030736, partial [Ameca splendens]